jgi:hypothetical protein
VGSLFLSSWRMPRAATPSNRRKPLMLRSFAPEASGSLLQKLFFYFGWTGLHNEVPESGFSVICSCLAVRPGNLPITRLCGEYVLDDAIGPG